MQLSNVGRSRFEKPIQIANSYGLRGSMSTKGEAKDIGYYGLIMLNGKETVAL